MPDPNNWVTDPPQTLVKIVNVSSKPELNNTFGVVLQYLEDRNRYIIHTSSSSSQPISLSPDNLVKCNMLESMRAQFDMIKNDPQVRAKIMEIYNQVATKTGIAKPEYLLIVLGVAIIAAMYLIGFSKTLFAISLLMFAGILVAPSIASGNTDIKQIILVDVPVQYRNILRTQVPVVGPVIANNKYLSALTAAIFMYMSGKVLFGSNSNIAKTDNSMTWQEGYRLGFDDATANRDYGASWTTSVNLDEWEYPQPQKSKLASNFNFSTLLSLGYLGKQINDLGRINNGTWSIGNLQYNVTHMDTMRMGFLALAVYRVVKIFM